jgi:hypothetical protein
VAALALAAAAAQGALARDGVADLRRVLVTPIGEPAAGSSGLDLRRQALTERVVALRGLPELRDALLLAEWRDEDVDQRVAAVDRAARAELGRRLDEGLNKVFRAGDVVNQQAAAQLIAELAEATRGRKISCWTPRRFGPVLATLTRADNAGVVMAAAHALGRVEPDLTTAAPALSALFECDQATLRRAAIDGLASLVAARAEALRRAGGAASTDVRGEAIRTCRAVLPVACGGLADPDPWVRSLSVEAIRQTALVLEELAEDCRPGTHADPVRAAAYRQEIEAERSELWPLVCELKDQTTGLTLALEDPDPGVRVPARHALEELTNAWTRLNGSTAATAPIAQALHVAAAVSGVGDLPGRPEWRQSPLETRLHASVPALAAGVADVNVRGRRAALDALEGCGEEAAPATRALVQALDDPDPFVRWAAARTLGKLRAVEGGKAVPGLIRLLDDPDLDVRLAAAEAMIQHGEHAAAAVPFLARAVGRGDAVMRVAAIQALEAIGPAAQAAIPAIADALSAPDVRVRRAAARLLGKFGPAASEFQEVLRLSLADRDQGVRKAVGDALLLIGPRAETPQPPAAEPALPIPATSAMTHENLSHQLGAWPPSPWGPPVQLPADSSSTAGPQTLPLPPGALPPANSPAPGVAPPLQPMPRDTGPALEQAPVEASRGTSATVPEPEAPAPAATATPPSPSPAAPAAKKVIEPEPVPAALMSVSPSMSLPALESTVPTVPAPAPAGPPPARLPVIMPIPAAATPIPESVPAARPPAYLPPTPFPAQTTSALDSGASSASKESPGGEAAGAPQSSGGMTRVAYPAPAAPVFEPPARPGQVIAATAGAGSPGSAPLPLPPVMTNAAIPLPAAPPATACRVVIASTGPAVPGQPAGPVR